jgi:hypothetical protein
MRKSRGRDSRPPIPTVPGGQPTFVFTSAFNTATGNGDAAVRDTNLTVPWTEHTNNLPYSTRSECRVVSATGLGFPAGMTNVLLADHYETTFSDVRVVDQWTAPVGTESLYFRLYYNCSIPNSYGNLPINSYHPIEPQPNNPPFEFEFLVEVKGDGTFKLWMAIALQVTGYATERYITPALNKFEAYRIEWRYIRQSTLDANRGLYKYDARITNSAGTVVADRTNMVASFDSHNTLAVDDPATPLTELSGTSSTVRALTIGTNGPASWDTPVAVGGVTRDAFTYYGGVAVSKQDWCGAYVAGEHT